MKGTRVALGLALIFMAALVVDVEAGVADANLITNGTANNADAAGWSISGRETKENDNPFTGQSSWSWPFVTASLEDAAVMLSTFQTSSSSLTITETIELTPGTCIFSFQYYYHTDYFSGYYYVSSVSPYNFAAVSINGFSTTRDNTIINTVAISMTTFTNTAIEDLSLLIALIGTGNGPSSRANLYEDKVILTQTSVGIPELTSLFLLGCGMLGIATAWRRGHRGLPP